MRTSELERFFEERLGEIFDYLDLLKDVENATRSGPPRLEGASSRITAAQQKILYSSVYLQLYNLVEATVSRCLDAVTSAAADSQWCPMNLNENLRREWIRVKARTHVDLTPENRLKFAVGMCDHLIQKFPIAQFSLEVGSGGNWDDDAIEKMSIRVGCKMAIAAKTREAVKRPVRDELGPLKLVKDRRNRLAHGSLSFVECSDEVSVSELKDLTQVVGNYLREVIVCFASYVEVKDFLHSDSKPAGIA